jgi:glycosidase
MRFLFGLSPNQLYRDYIGVLDGVLDFYVQSQLRQYIKSARSPSDRRAFEQRISKHFSAFPSGYYLPVFLDNHDMDRFLYICGNDKELLKEASKILFSLNQPVIIYYGTEAGLTQNESIRSQKTHGDLLARQSMNWDKRDADLFGFFQELIKKTGMRG